MHSFLLCYSRWTTHTHTEQSVRGVCATPGSCVVFHSVIRGDLGEWGSRYQQGAVIETWSGRRSTGTKEPELIRDRQTPHHPGDSCAHTHTHTHSPSLCRTKTHVHGNSHKSTCAHTHTPTALCCCQSHCHTLVHAHTLHCWLSLWVKVPAFTIKNRPQRNTYKAFLLYKIAAQQSCLGQSMPTNAV